MKNYEQELLELPEKIEILELKNLELFEILDKEEVFIYLNNFEEDDKKTSETYRMKFVKGTIYRKANFFVVDYAKIQTDYKKNLIMIYKLKNKQENLRIILGR